MSHNESPDFLLTRSYELSPDTLLRRTSKSQIKEKPFVRDPYLHSLIRRSSNAVAVSSEKKSSGEAKVRFSRVLRLKPCTAETKRRGEEAAGRSKTPKENLRQFGQTSRVNKLQGVFKGGLEGTIQPNLTQNGDNVLSVRISKITLPRLSVSNDRQCKFLDTYNSRDNTPLRTSPYKSIEVSPLNVSIIRLQKRVSVRPKTRETESSGLSQTKKIALSFIAKNWKVTNLFLERQQKKRPTVELAVKTFDYEMLMPPRVVVVKSRVANSHATIV